MKLYFENAEKVAQAIKLVSSDLNIELTDKKSADITVSVNEKDERVLELLLDEKFANITYGGGTATFLRALAMLTFAVKRGENKKSISESPIFRLNGAMVDMSRNAVMKVDTVKFMLRKMALMGQNAFMLYTEDTYEIEGRPYFGYMRGRYTKEELKELDAYALTLGIELIPCIQTLGHLATMLRWTCTTPYKDTPTCMMVGSAETYKLIDDMLKTVSECFTTKRIHVGMDETRGLGTGTYLSKNGYRNEKEIYLEHLNKVTDMCLSYGFKPMMWSDMIILLSGTAKDVYDPDAVITDEYAASVPKDMQQVFWDYYNASESFYAKNIANHRKICKNTMFAGGIWEWNTMCPLFSRSLGFTIPALEACKKGGVSEVIGTVWHNGAESSLISSLAGLVWYADYGYKGEYNEESVKECFAFSCGENYDDFMALQDPERPDGGILPLSRSFVYNDPLVGLIDAHLENLETDDYYKSIAKKLAEIKVNDEMFAPLFDVVAKLSSFLENKASFGVRLKRAYDAHDKNTLEKMANECDVIAEKLGALRRAHRASWLKYNKPFGWEILDIRYGGIASRIDTAKFRILAYLNGEEASIPELEEERLRIDCKSQDEEPFNNGFNWRSYDTIASTGVFA